MKRCPKCMKEYDDSARFCRKDGEDLILAIAVAPHSARGGPERPKGPNSDESDGGIGELPDITVLHYGGAFNFEPERGAEVGQRHPTDADATSILGSGSSSASPSAQGSSPLPPKPSSENEDPFEGRFLANRYRIQERLSSGGMGMVYKAIDERLNGLEVAIKFIRPEIARRSRFRQIFQNAELLIAKIQHTNVVRVYNLDETDEGYLYLVMDFVRGESLRHYIYNLEKDGASGRRSKKRQIREDAELMRQIASGLHAMHQARIVHRDLKPDNILLAEGPEGGAVPRIIDFGIAAEVDAETGQTGLDDASHIMSTNYAPPEQILHRPMDYRSDVFSFGLIGYELFARQNPLRVRTAERSKPKPTRSRSTRAMAASPAADSGTVLQAARQAQSSGASVVPESQDSETAQAEQRSSLERDRDHPASEAPGS